MEKFGFGRTVDGWERKRTGLARTALLVSAALLGGFAVVNLFSRAPLGVKVLGLVLGGGGAAACVRLINGAVIRIDLHRRAFITRGLLGEQVLLFDELGKLVPTRLPVDGVPYGIYYEAFRRAEVEKTTGGMRVSDTYTDEALAEEFYPAVQLLIQSTSPPRSWARPESTR